MSFEFTEQGAFVLDFINQTSRHIFLTGKAGTGKTTLLKHVLEQTHKNVVVVAPTGIAALNAGGVTIHSMFQLPLETFLPQDYWGASSESKMFVTPKTLRNQFRMSAEKQRVIRRMDVLIIDEVSMLRADTLDALELTMRRVRGNNSSFGGVQVVFIGDLMQLPPVTKPEEEEVLSLFYKSAYFFDATCLLKHAPLYIELKKIFRQDEPEFIELLNRLRNSSLTQADAILLQKYYQPSFSLSENPGTIYLTTHNYKAARVNESSLNALRQTKFVYSADIQGDFPEKIFPVDANMELKIGAQVMFTRNDTDFEKRYYNGKIGTVAYLDEETVKVRTHDDNKLITVDKHEWENVKYSINEETKFVQSIVIGTFVQYPLRLAWAITIHKSQGLTFTKAALDVEDVFQSGQAYVAFSRLRSLSGLVLLSPLHLNKHPHDQHIVDYTRRELDSSVLQNMLVASSEQYIGGLLKESFDINPLYKVWLKHQRSYYEAPPKSVKLESQSWADDMGNHLKLLQEVSENFSRFVDNKFNAQNYDLVLQKTQSARDYYTKHLEQFAEDLIIQLARLNKKKKVKSYFNELLEFEELFLTFIQRMEDCVVLTEAFISRKKIEKSMFDRNYIRRFKERIMERAKSKILQKSAEDLVQISGEDVHLNYDTTEKSKSKDTKPPKVPSAEISFAMFLEGKTIQEISAERMFTESTITSHLADMVKIGKLEAEKVVPVNKIQKIESVLDENPDWEGLKPYKELLGDEYSFGELRIVLAKREYEQLQSKHLEEL